MGVELPDDSYADDTVLSTSPLLEPVRPHLYPHKSPPLKDLSSDELVERYGCDEDDLDNDPWPGIGDVEAVDEDELEFEIETAAPPLIKVTREARQRILNGIARRAVQEANPSGEVGEFQCQHQPLQTSFRESV